MYDPGKPTMTYKSLLLEAEHCIHAGRLKEASLLYAKLLEQRPKASALHHTMGLVLIELNDMHHGIFHLRESLRLNPNFAKAYRSLGDAYCNTGQIAASLSAYKKAQAIDPKDPDTAINLGNLFYRMDQLPEALATFHQALCLAPDSVKALNNIGKTHQDMGEFDRALKYYNRCLQIAPNYAEARFNRSVALLTVGDYPYGWQEYEWRFRRRKAAQVYPHKLSTPRWAGQSYRGKRLLVHCEQGLGDAIQFVRYLPWVKQLGGTLILEAHAPLAPLFKDLPYVDELVIFDSHRPPTIAHQLHIPLMSLPGLFNITEEHFSRPVPYLHSDAGHQKKWQHLMSTKDLKIGLVWAGSDTNPKRNFPLEQCRAWFQLPGIHLFSLQKGVAEDQIKNYSEIVPVTALGHRLNDFRDTAAIVADLDLIISIDTAVAHLAGAMGKPVWVLLPYSADWRWPPHRKLSPWYPTARIFRQPKLDDWYPVTAQIMQALNQWRQTQSLAKEMNLNRSMELKIYPTLIKQDTFSNGPQRGLRMKQRTPPPHYGLAKLRQHPHHQKGLTIPSKSRIKNVILISPIYGGSYEVIRYLYSGFIQAGFSTFFQDNSAAYTAYKNIEQGPYEPGFKDQLFGQLITAIDQQLLTSVEKHKPDLVVVAAQSPIHDETVAKLKSKGIACVYWFVEDFRFRRYWAQKAPLYDYFFTIQRGADLKHQFDTMGISNWSYLPLACDPMIHKTWHAPPEKKHLYRCQIGFMGAPYRNRIKMFESLTQWDLGIWGEGWDDHESTAPLKRCIKQGKKRISVSESVKIYCCSDIVINLHSSPFTDGISADGDFVNPRTFEVAGCSGFQLCDKRMELPAHFKPGKEIIVFNSTDELKSLIAYWISRPNLRKKISMLAQKRAYSEHTYMHRAKEIVRIIDQ